MITAERLKELISTVERIGLVDDFAIDETGSLFGRISVDTGSDSSELVWDVEVSPNYPFKIMGIEPIRFVNKDLLSYSHIMQAGNLCMHPAEYEDAEDQFINDLEQLKEWVDKYYVRGEKDDHYEHLVVNHYPIREEYFTYAFTETDGEFKKMDYGLVNYTSLLCGVKHNRTVNNFIVQKFLSYQQVRPKELPCKINQIYKNLASSEGVFCILSTIPSMYDKFILEDYDSIAGLFSQQQKDFIYKFVQAKGRTISSFPLFCGYEIPNGEVHWQVMMLFVDNLPLKAIHIDTGKNKIWCTEFTPGKIQWAETNDISYKYFFGRGAMPEDLANKKILILGVGAIGSIVAETLTRCGAKFLTLYDIDNKEPGNVCRSAYQFSTGICEKTDELDKLLSHISPHVECRILKQEVDSVVKSYAATHKDTTPLSGFFNKFDIIFDCTTDNQLMRVIDSTGTQAQVINMSITNHAQDLVCAFSPNVKETVSLVYTMLGKDSDKDLYNPTGCWSPTFKASYNDISSKVQYALKHIVNMLCSLEPMSSFYITENELNLNMHRL